MAGKKKAKLLARLTKSKIAEVPIPPAGQRSIMWDTEVKGFGIRVSPGGARTYILRYRMGGRDTQARTVTIGQHGSPWTPDLARKRAVELLGQVRSGIDHVAQRATAREGAANAVVQRDKRMFGKLADRWFREHVQRSGLRSEKDIEGVLERDLKPAFAGRSIDEITKQDVSDALELIGNRSGSAANKCHKWLRQLLNWLIGKGVIKISPMEKMPQPFPQPSRKRVLSLMELVVVWVALDALSEPFRSYYRLLILLGQRLREVAGLPWGELDMDAAEWLLPAARTKNKRDHLVPLSPQALRLLSEFQPDADLRSGPVFTTNGKVAINGFSKLKEALDEAVAALISASPEALALVGPGLAGWVVHDLRRSLATGCQAMGIPIATTEAVLNHISEVLSGVAGIYQLYDYFDEKADALERWGTLIDAALECWGRGDVAGIVALDPSTRARTARRDRRLSRAAPVQSRG